MHIIPTFHDFQIERVIRAVREAGRMALELRKNGLTIDKKDDGTIVTNADIEISRYLKNELKFKEDAAYFCEEIAITDSYDKKDFWLIDPIDSTKSYAANKDSFTINVAYVENKKAAYGFIYAPAWDVLFYTNHDMQLIVEGAGSISKIIGNTKDTNSSLAIVGSGAESTRLQRFVQKKAIEKVIKLPSSLKLALVAAKKALVSPRFLPTMEWDTASGHALIKAAGGNIVDLKGNEVIYGKEGFLNSDYLASWDKKMLEISREDKF